MHYTYPSFNNLKNSLSTQDVDQLMELLGSRLRAPNLTKLRRRLESHTALIPSFGILERLVKEDGAWTYTAGQSYPDEIRVVRSCILNLE